jgi:glycosyltransferase involved in cell wall biosynthesis
MRINSLAIVMPVYNEQDNIQKVLKMWLKKIKLFNFKKFNFIIINDGSTDLTLKNIKKINSKHFVIINTKNNGHGSACLTGYKFAVKNDYEWIFQIDSDGQCNPKYFSLFIKKSEEKPIIFGHRHKRNDGLMRLFFSKILTILIFFKTNLFIKDANVPYRLIKSNYLKKVIRKFPSKLILKNILISIRLKFFFNNIYFIPIVFDKRISGKTKYNLCSLFIQMKNLFLYI